MDKSKLEQIWSKQSSEYEWVIARYRGDRAKRVKERADSGVGYVVRTESGSGNNYEIEVAFRRVIDGPTPESLVVADSRQEEYLEKAYNRDATTI